MLRLTVLLLVLANAVYFAWSQGLLAVWGFAPVQQSEPQRLEQQIRPQSLRILGSDDLKRLESAGAPRPAECLQAGPIDDGQLASLRQVMEPWPPGSWTLEAAVDPARWIIYMGKYPSAEAVTRKKAELRQMGVSFETLANPTLEPGLSLGGFATEEAATQQMGQLAQRGVRTARVVQERPEVRGQQLKLPAVDDSLRGRLDELKTALNGKALRPCR